MNQRMRTLSIFCLALALTGAKAMADRVDAKPSEVLQFREATPSRAPAAVNAQEKADKPLVKQTERKDPESEAYFCIECDDVNPQRADNIIDHGQDIKKFVEANLRPKQ